MFPHDTIEAAKFPQIIRSVSSWYFSDEIITTYARLDSVVYFDILLMFFTAKPAQILKEFDEHFVNYFKDELST